MAEESRQALAAAGHNVAACATRATPAECWLPELLKDRDLAVVVGGDGAVRLVAGTLAALDVPLWHVPGGTENLIARYFGMGAAPAQLVAAADAMQTRCIDCGRLDVGGVVSDFLLMASVGFDAATVHDLAARRRGPIRRWHYAPAILRQWWNWRAPEVTLAVDGASPEKLGRGTLVIGNLPTYGFHLNLLDVADPCDGALDALFLPCATGTEAIRWAARFWGRSPRELPGARRFRGAAFRVEVCGEGPAGWQTDGDACPLPANRSGHAQVQVSPRKIHVLVPQP